MLPSVGWAQAELLEYSDYNDGVQIKKLKAAPEDGCVKIPAEINGKKVLQIYQNAFNYASNPIEIKKVIIPNTVQRIGAAAFKSSPITSITIPASVTEISSSVFEDSSISQINFESGSNLQKIGGYAFTNSDLRSITIPESVTSINITAWGTQMQYITLLRKSPTYSTKLFDQCTDLKKVYVPEDAVDTYKAYFTDKANLIYPITSDITYGELTYQLNDDGETVTCIGLENADELANLTYLDIPSKITDNGKEYAVTAIAENAFKGASKLKSIYFGKFENKLTIGESAFADCDQLKTIVFGTEPDANSTEDFFANFSNLENIVVYPEKYAAYQEKLGSSDYAAKLVKNYWGKEFTVNGYKYKVNDYTSVTCTGYTGASTDLKFDATVTLNDDYGECTFDLTEIGQNAFYANNKIQSVTFAEDSKLKTIGGSAFYATNISSVEIPASVTTIGDNAFFISNFKTAKFKRADLTDCNYSNSKIFGSDVRKIYVPAKAYDAYKAALSSKYTNIIEKSYLGEEITDDNLKYRVDKEDLNNGSEVTCTGVAEGKNPTKIEFYTSISGNYYITGIAANAFKDNADLTSVEFYTSRVGTIGESAFENCTNLTKVSGEWYDDYFKTISAKAFKNTSLKSFIVKESVTKIGAEAFGSCQNLVNVTFKSTTPGEDYDAKMFDGSDNLKTITVPAEAYEAYSTKFAALVAKGVKIVKSYVGAIFQNPEDQLYYKVIEDAEGQQVASCLGVTKGYNGEGGYFPGEGEGEGSGSSESEPVTYPTNVVIASKVTYKDLTLDVTALGSNNEYGSGGFANKKIETLDIPASIKDFGHSTFRNCTSLTEVIWRCAYDENLGWSASYSFEGCTALEKIFVPVDNLTKYREFFGNVITNLGKLSYDVVQPLWAGLEFEHKDFKYKVNDDNKSATCLGLKDPEANPSSLEFPDWAWISREIDKGDYSQYESERFTVDDYADNAFANCDKLETITMDAAFPNYRYENLFRGISNLKKIMVSADALSLYRSAFPEWKDKIFAFYTPGVEITVDGLKYKVNDDKTSVSFVSIAKNTETITNITIPASITTEDGTDFKVTNVPADALNDCTALETITFESKEKNIINSLSSDMLTGCTSLKTIKVPAEAYDLYKAKFGAWADAQDPKVKFIKDYITVDGLKYQVNDDNKTLTFAGLAENAEMPENLVIPVSVTEDGTSYELTTIPANAFSNATAEQKAMLKTVTFERKENIDGYDAAMFDGCTGLKNITVPAAAYEQYKEKFGDLVANQNVEIIKNYAGEEITADGLTYKVNDDNATVTLAGLAENTKMPEELTFPATVTKDEATFKLTNIPANAFDAVSTEQKNVVKTVTFTSTENIDGFDANMLAGFTNLKNIKVPAEAYDLYKAKFGAWADAQDPKVEIVKVYEDKEITVGDLKLKLKMNADNQSVTIEGLADGAEMPKTLTIPTTIAWDENTTVKVTGIADNAFKGQENLETVIFEGGDITSIGTDAFANCENLTQILVPAESYEAYMSLLKNKISENVQVLINRPEFALTNEADVKNTPEGFYGEGKLSYKRSISEEEQGNYITVTLPFDIDLADERYAGKFESVNLLEQEIIYHAKDNKYQFAFENALEDGAESNVIEANTPMLIKLASGVTEVEFFNCEQLVVDETFGDNVSAPFIVKDTDGNEVNDIKAELVANYENQNGSEVYYTFNQDGTFGKQLTDKIAPFSLYIKITDQDGNPVKKPEDPGTGIDGISSDSTKKSTNIYSHDGKLVRTDGNTEGLTKGVYIINGKKIVVK